ncbi:MAG: hypothetical protein M3083_20870 [Actinomycetota bacterium]|nr:hypothetical protein [Actinomycetota bacterium]
MSAASIIAVVAVSGCGGGSNKPALTREAFVARANPICASAAQQIKAGASSVFPDPQQAAAQNPDRVNTYASNVVLPALRMERDQLRALAPVTDPAYPSLMNELQKGIDRWAADKTIMAAETDTSFSQFDAVATDLGLATCAGTDRMVRIITGGSFAVR